MSVVELAREECLKEMRMHGLPELFVVLPEETAARLAKLLGANEEVVRLGSLFMDMKVGEAGKLGKYNEHIAMSAACADELMKQWDVSDPTRVAVLVCIEEHHAVIPFTSKESEICANADCYKFLHPSGIMAYLHLLGFRQTSLKDALNQLESKMDEKHKILSIDICKQELELNYQEFKGWLASARRFP
jgi:hypothetical protein